MKKPTICGKNRLNIPNAGCTDCSQLEYRMNKLEDEVEEFINSFAPMTDSMIESLTPIDCLQPVGSSGLVCTGQACLAIVCNDTSVPPEDAEGDEPVTDNEIIPIVAE